MFCRSCGKQLNDGASFCNGCGAQLRANDAAEQRTAPMQRVDIPDAAPAPARSNTGLIVALAIVGVLLIGGGIVAGLYFTGAFESTDIASSRVDEATAKADKKKSSKDDADTTDASSDGTESTTTLNDDASYDMIAEHYLTLSELADQIGRANADGTYGGTGFAYDVFNLSIGSADKGVRESLVTKCQQMLDTISGQKQGLEEARVSANYEPQKQDLIGLYQLLETRANAMLSAATVAVQDPAESAWRPYLSPVSTESREQFEAEYPNAEPVRQ